MSKIRMCDFRTKWDLRALLLALMVLGLRAHADEIPTIQPSSADAGFTWILAPSLNAWIGTANTIYCQDSTPSLKIYDNDPECVEIADCVRVHENTHLKDALANHPHICAGNKGEAIIAVTDSAQRLASEMKAYNNELICLAAAFRTAKTVDCRIKINIQMTTIKEYTLPLVRAGNYP